MKINELRSGVLVEAIMSRVEDIDNPLDDEGFHSLKAQFDALSSKLCRRVVAYICALISSMILSIVSPQIFEHQDVQLFLAIAAFILMLTFFYLAVTNPFMNLAPKSFFEAAPDDFIKRIHKLKNTSAVTNFLASFRCAERKRPITLLEALAVIRAAEDEDVPTDEERDVKYALNLS